MHPDASLIIGSAIDDSIADEFRITVAATGFGETHGHLCDERAVIEESIQASLPVLDRDDLKISGLLRRRGQ